MASEMSKGLKQGIGIAIGGCGCLILCFIGCLVIVGTGVESVRQEQEKQATNDKVTLENFNKIQTGMTVNEVYAILGEPAETLSENEIGGTKTKMVQWTQSGLMGGNMNVMFQDDKVIQKAQFGLK
jgi:hypothetical protein